MQFANPEINMNSDSDIPKLKNILYTFSKELECLEDSIVSDQCYDESFYTQSDKEWFIFWDTVGNEIVLDSWNKRYQEYVCCDVDEKEDTISSPNINNSTVESDWQYLWESHFEQIQNTVYQTYQQNLYISNDFIKRSLLNNNISDNIFIFQDYEQDLSRELKELGLPTKFGSRRKSNRKEQKFYYLETLSDSESLSEEEDDFEMDSDKNNTNNIFSITKTIQKKKKSKATLKNVPAYIKEDKTMLKYWYKRFSLFSRFDEGIQLDKESWFSVTPEKIAAKAAQRLKCDVIIDAFCGSGGNTIQFAKTCQKVIAIDIDPQKIAQARHNAKIYGVEKNIEFIVGDFTQLSKALKADVVFLSPPWGGPDYNKYTFYDIEKSLIPVSASALVELSRQITQNIAIYLPRNSDVQQIVKIAGVGRRTEIETSFLNSRPVALTAYFGGLLNEVK